MKDETMMMCFSDRYVENASFETKRGICIDLELDWWMERLSDRDARRVYKNFDETYNRRYFRKRFSVNITLS